MSSVLRTQGTQSAASIQNMRKTQTVAAADWVLATKGRKPSAIGHRLSQGVTLESLCYLAILVVALVTRFWDLGSRALHFDESEHAYFSWIFAEGFGYRHDPLLHGPILFHLNALVYILSGATDETSRLAPALAGVILVMLPWLLRGDRLLGRWGALIASALLLISPSILYYSRFIRHDIFCLLGTFALFIAIVRYRETPEPRWLLLGGVSLGFLFSTEEVSFIVAFIFGTFLCISLARRVAPALFAVAGGALVLLGILDKLLKLAGMGPLPGIPWQNPTNAQLLDFTVKLITHPLVVSGLGVLALAVVAGIWVLRRRRIPGRGWVDSLLGDAPAGTTAAALRRMLRQRRAVAAAAFVAALILVVLYTSLFSNLYGLATGSVGALGYWLGQQGVQRGEQPWFYYLLLLPQYEAIAVLFLPVAAVLIVYRWLGARRRRRPLEPRAYIRLFLLYWSLLMLAVLSWAGEKMPWIDIHIALPLTLLAASFLGEAAELLERHWSPQLRRRALASGGALLGLGLCGFLLMTWASAGPYVTVNNALQRTIRPSMAAHWWVVWLPWLALLGLIAVLLWRLGARRALAVVALSATLGLALFQVHAEWRLTYREGDVAKDMLIYVQTPPQVVQVTDQITALSRLTTGGLGMEIAYDNVTQWPFNWYLRNFPNRRIFGSTLSSPPNAPIVLVAQENETPALEQQLSNYVYQEYPLRWWFPEEQTYRRFAYAPDLNDPTRQDYQDSRKPPFSLLDIARSVGSSLWAMHEPQEQGKVFRLVADRELPAPLGTYTFRVYVRKDLVPLWNSLRY